MRKQSIVLAVVLLFVPFAAAYAQQCLHAAGEAREQTARRRAALTAARTVNNIQYNRPEARNNVFLAHADLASSPFAKNMSPTNGISLDPSTEIVPGWKLTLDVTSNGYWFMVKDSVDPCGFAYISNQTGLIFTAEPLR